MGEYKIIPVAWAQRKDNIMLTLNIVEADETQIEMSEKKLKFVANGGSKTSRERYGVELEFFDKILPEKSNWSIKGRNVEFVIGKKTKGEHWPRLLKEETKFKWLTLDWANFMDEEMEQSSIKKKQKEIEQEKKEKEKKEKKSEKKEESKDSKKQSNVLPKRPEATYGYTIFTIIFNVIAILICISMIAHSAYQYLMSNT